MPIAEISIFAAVGLLNLPLFGNDDFLSTHISVAENHDDMLLQHNAILSNSNKDIFVSKSPHLLKTKSLTHQSKTRKTPPDFQKTDIPGDFAPPMPKYYNWGPPVIGPDSAEVVPNILPAAWRISESAYKERSNAIADVLRQVRNCRGTRAEKAMLLVKGLKAAGILMVASDYDKTMTSDTDGFTQPNEKWAALTTDFRYLADAAAKENLRITVATWSDPESWQTTQENDRRFTNCSFGPQCVTGSLARCHRDHPEFKVDIEAIVYGYPPYRQLTNKKLKMTNDKNWHILNIAERTKKTSESVDPSETVLLEDIEGNATGAASVGAFGILVGPGGFNLDNLTLMK